MRLRTAVAARAKIARPATVNADMVVTPGVDRVDVVDTSTAYVTLNSWSYQLKQNGTPVGSPLTDQNPSFDPVTPGSGYTILQTVTSIHGYSDSFECPPFTVNPGVVPTPTLTAGTPAALVVPLTLSAVVDQSKVRERRIYYKLGSAPTTSDAFLIVAVDVTITEFAAPSTGTWHFKAQDIAVVELATDSALSAADTNVTLSSGGSPPAAVTGLTATAIGPHRIDLDWTDDGAQKNIYRVPGNNPGFTPDATNLLKGELAGDQSFWSDQLVSPDTEYTYKVETINLAGQAFAAAVVESTPPQGAWPENESLMYTEVGSSITGSAALFTPYQGQPNTQWAGNYFNYSGLYVTGVGPDGVTPLMTHMTDAAAKYNSTCLIKRRWAAQGEQTGYGSVFLTRAKFGGGPFQVIYARIVLELAANWQNHTGHTKLFYWGNTSSKNHKPNVYAFFLRGGTGSGFHIDCDNADTGTVQFIANGGPWIARGIRQTIEFIARSESAVGACDGKIRVRINGQLVTSYTYNGNNSVVRAAHEAGSGQLDTIMFTKAPGTVHKFDGSQFFEYKGGNPPWSQTVDDYIKIDEWYWTGKAAA